MAVSYCVTVGIILFFRYENCFVLMHFGRSPFNIAHRLFHGSAAWIRTYRRFPEMNDFHRELGVQRLSLISSVVSVVVCTVICGDPWCIRLDDLWCIRRGGVRKLAEEEACCMLRRVCLVIIIILCNMCLYVLFTHVIELLIKVTNCT